MANDFELDPRGSPLYPMFFDAWADLIEVDPATGDCRVVEDASVDALMGVRLFAADLYGFGGSLMLSSLVEADVVRAKQGLHAVNHPGDIL